MLTIPSKIMGLPFVEALLGDLSRRLADLMLTEAIPVVLVLTTAHERDAAIPEGSKVWCCIDSSPWIHAVRELR